MQTPRKSLVTQISRGMRFTDLILFETKSRATEPTSVPIIFVEDNINKVSLV